MNKITSSKDVSVAVYLSEPALISPLGVGLDANARAIFDGIPALRPDSQWMPNENKYVGAATSELPSIPENLRAFSCRNNQLLMSALAQLQEPIAQLKRQFPAHRIGVVVGSSTSGIAAGEEAITAREKTGKFPSDFNYRQQEIGTPALFVSRYLELTGPSYTISTACTSSAQAIISARALIEAELCDAVIVGGADSLCQLTIQGFSSLESYADNVCAPFSGQRDGINIGEGAVLFLMTKTPTPYRLLGAAASSDAHHISAPHPEGLGAQKAIEQALKDADIAPEAIEYVNLHGTATPKNDEMEATVMHRIFGDSVACSSTKSLTGHMLGAAGAMELAVCLLALKHQRIPIQTAQAEFDPSLPMLKLKTKAEAMPLQTVMSTNYAFGGNNVALILQRSTVEHT